METPTASNPLIPATGFGTVPEAVRSRVTIAPPEAWVEVRPYDETWVTPDRGSQSILLIDHQGRPTEHRYYYRLVRRLETLPAVQDAAQWKLDFDPATQHVKLHSLSVRRGSEKKDHAVPEKLRFLQREEQLDSYVLDGLISLVALLEDVRVGDILDVSWTTSRAPRLFADKASCLFHVPSRIPIRAFHTRVTFPTDRALRWKTGPTEMEPAKRQIGDETEWAWNLEKTTSIETEPTTPSWHIVDRWFQISDFTSWSEVATGITAAWAEEISSAALDRAIAELGGTDTPLATRVERALVLVQDEIRYFSSNAELGGQIPSPPSTVLGRRFGDCKDKSFLLVHLLRRLGVPAHALLVHTDWRKSIADWLPASGVFNHAIVEYELEGRQCVIDATQPQQGGGPLRRATSDFQLGLRIATDGSDRLTSIPQPESKEPLLEVRETFLLDTSGQPSILQMIIKGLDGEADRLRRYISREGPIAIARQQEQIYRNAFHELRRIGELEWHDNRDRNEVAFAVAFELPRTFAGMANAQHLIFRWRAHLVSSVLSVGDLSNRKQPVALPYPCHHAHIIELQSPGLLAGEDARVSVETSFAKAFVEARRAPGQHRVRLTVQTLTDALLPKDFDQYEERMKKIAPHLTVEAALKPNGYIVPRQRRSERLLASVVSQTDRPFRPAGPRPARTRPEKAQPKSEPAVALAESTATEIQPELSFAAEPAAPEAEAAVAVSELPTRADHPMALGEEPVRRRRRSRRRRQGSDRDWKLLLAGLGGLLVIVVLIYLNVTRR